MSEYTLNLILDEVVKIRQLLEAPSKAVSVPLSLSEIQVGETANRIQTELLTRARITGFRLPGTDYEGKMPSNPEED